MAFVRTVKTSSGATAVQIVHPARKGSRKIEYLGSACTLAEVEALKAVAAQRLAQWQAAGLNGLGAAADDTLLHQDSRSPRAAGDAVQQATGRADRRFAVDDGAGLVGHDQGRATLGPARAE